MQRSRVGQEPRCSSSSSCSEAMGAGSFPHTRLAGSAGPSNYLLSAGEARSLTSHLLLGCRGAGAKKRNREDKGQVSNASTAPWWWPRQLQGTPAACLVLHLALPSPSHLQWIKRCSARAPLAGQMPQTSSWKAMGFQHPGKDGGPGAAQGESSLPGSRDALKQPIPWQGQDQPWWGWMLHLQPQQPMVLTCGGTKPQPNISPPCRHHQPDHEAGIFFIPRAHQTVGCPAAAQLSHDPLPPGISQQLMNKVSASTPVDLGCNFMPKLFTTEITAL